VFSLIQTLYFCILLNVNFILQRLKNVYCVLNNKNRKMLACKTWHILLKSVTKASDKIEEPVGLQRGTWLEICRLNGGKSLLDKEWRKRIIRVSYKALYWVCYVRQEKKYNKRQRPGIMNNDNLKIITETTDCTDTIILRGFITLKLRWIIVALQVIIGTATI
jgi:tRNA threonylcarbamoyladenosine modification (KEOPS) complex  Pcc1 subunit